MSCSMFMSIDELASQKDKFIMDYGAYYRLPHYLSAPKIVGCIAAISDHERVPLLPHFIYEFSKTGWVLITGRVSASVEPSRQGTAHGSSGSHDVQQDDIESVSAQRRPLVRGSHRNIAYREARQRLAELEAQDAIPVYEPTGTVPLGYTRIPPGMATTPIFSGDISSSEATPGSRSGLSASAQVHRAPSPSPPQKREASSRDQDDEADDDAGVTSHSPVPFPTIDAFPDDSSPRGSPKSQHSVVPPPQSSAPRFTYPPNVKGDWLDIMLQDLRSGRSDVHDALEKAKQQLRLSFESVMKAQMELEAEHEEWDGFKKYLTELVGQDWFEELEQDAQMMQERGSDYGSDDEGGDGGADAGGNGDDDDVGDNGGDERGQDGPHERDNLDDGSSSEEDDQDYQTPSRPPRTAPALTKRKRENEDPQDDAEQEEGANAPTTRPSKRTKFSHISSYFPSQLSPGKSDDREGLRPCSNYPPTPHPKRTRSPSPGSEVEEEEVERSVKLLARDNSSWNMDIPSHGKSVSARMHNPYRPHTTHRMPPQHASKVDWDNAEAYYPAAPDDEDEPNYSYPQVHYDYGGPTDNAQAGPASTPSSALGFLGRIFNLTQSQQQTSAPSAYQPPSPAGHLSPALSFDVILSPLQNGAGASGPEPCPSNAPQPHYTPLSHPSSSRPRGAPMPDGGLCPLTRAYDRVFESSDPEQRYQIHRYDELEEYHRHMERHDRLMKEMWNLPDWQAPARYGEEYAEMTAVAPVAMYRFLDE